jgi:hypothetical protein
MDNAKSSGAGAQCAASVSTPFFIFLGVAGAIAAALWVVLK